MTKKLPVNVKIIRYAIRLLQRGWTKEFFARDNHGNPVQPYDKAACCWCMEGALLVASSKIQPSAYETLITSNNWLKVLPENHFSVNHFNDCAASVDEVINALQYFADLESI